MSEAYNLNNIATGLDSVGTFRAGFQDRVEYALFNTPNEKRRLKEDDFDDDFEDISTFCKCVYDNAEVCLSHLNLP